MTIKGDLLIWRQEAQNDQGQINAITINLIETNQFNSVDPKCILCIASILKVS